MDEPFITAPIYPPSILLTGHPGQQRRRALRRRGQLPLADVAVRDGAARPARRTSSSTASTASSPATGCSCRSSTPTTRSPSSRPRLGLPARLGPADARPLQRARRAGRGPRLPQGRELPRAPQDTGPLGGLRPPARQGDVRRVHPRRHPGHGRRPGAAARRLGDRGPVRRRAPAPPTSPRTARATAPAPSSARGRSSAAGRAARGGSFTGRPMNSRWTRTFIARREFVGRPTKLSRP